MVLLSEIEFGHYVINLNLPDSAPVAAAVLELPTHVPYLLIGAGTSSFAAFRAIKSRDPKAKVNIYTKIIQKNQSNIIKPSISFGITSILFDV